MSSYYPNDYELTFQELAIILWRKRLFIFFTSLICIGLSEVYSLCSKPVYVYQVNVQPSSNFDFHKLNFAATHNGKGAFTTFQVETLYSIFTRELLSEKTKNLFFENVYWPYFKQKNKSVSKKVIYNHFLKNFNIVPQSLTPQPTYLVKMKGGTNSNLKDFSLEYIQFARNEANIVIKNNIDREVKTHLYYLQHEMQFIKKLSSKVLNDKLSHYKEALHEAEIAKSNHFDSSKAARFHFEDFMLGTDLLRSKMHSLENKTISSSLLKKYRTMQLNYYFYSNLNISTKDLIPYELQFSNSPKLVSLGTSFVLLLGLIAGLVLSGIIIFVSLFFKIVVTNNTLKDKINLGHPGLLTS